MEEIVETAVDILSEVCDSKRGCLIVLGITVIGILIGIFVL